MSTLRNKCLLRSLEMLESNNFRRVAVNDLKKISEAFKILQDTNVTLTRNMQKMSSYYAEKYKTKLNQLQALVVKKDKQLRVLHKQARGERPQNCVHRSP
ncbi:hypothetical protein [Rachiplusia nu nucleopolyhedrovirus]|uniref:Uncharacterized protein n=1 Tax=Rachiplusia nu nucleopolyhedrovirus TaxID=2605775 RepID=A0AAE6IRC6_9ABAC|nr:hypothetical protein QKQ55_gp126 [Rachiplusia nu nucleopolyhedrovirus]QEI03634.1 hypothetical protein [Rachiplusia nu nucleopolyhedrovirus]